MVVDGGGTSKARVDAWAVTFEQADRTTLAFDMQ